MAEYQALRISRRNPDRWAADGDRYWLRFLQEQEDDKITYAEVAELVDTLYDIDPCIEPEQADVPEITPPTPEKLYQSAAEIFGYNMASCRTAMSGEYTEQIKVIRSHPLESEPYQLVLSAGTVTMTQRQGERLTLDLDISGGTYIALDWPVLGNFTGEWLGTVIGQDGPIAPPPLSEKYNTVYWEQTATGTLRVTFDTEYDLVTIVVPGKPDAPGSESGQPQDVKLLAFYHFLIFTGEMVAPPQDETLGPAALRQLCGFMTLTPGGLHVTQGGGTGIDSDEPIDAPPDEPEYGCQDEEERYGRSDVYEKVCCHPPKFIPESCLIRTARNPGGMEMDEDEKQAYLDKNPYTEFIPVGPDGAEGCGTITWRLDIVQKSCCGEATALAWDTINSAETIGASSYADVYVTGGLIPITWKVRGKGCWTNPSHTQRDIVANRGIRVYTDSTACGMCQITADDGCSSITGKLRITAGTWQFVKDISGMALQSDDNWHVSGPADTSVRVSDKVVNTKIEGEYKLEETLGMFGVTSGCHPINLGNARCACAENALDQKLADPFYNYGPSGEEKKLTGGLLLMDCFDLDKCTYNGFGEPTTCSYYCWPCHPWLIYIYIGGGTYSVQAEIVTRRRLWKWVC